MIIVCVRLIIVHVLINTRYKRKRVFQIYTLISKKFIGNNIKIVNL